MSRFTLFLVAAVVLTALLALVVVLAPGTDPDPARLLKGALLLAFLGSAMLGAVVIRPGQSLRHVLIWIGAGALLILLYRLWQSVAGGGG